MKKKAKINYLSYELPKVFVNKEIQTDVARDIEAAEAWINNELKAAIEAEALTFDVATVSGMGRDQDYTKKLMDTEFNTYVRSLKGFVPPKEKERIKVSYDSITERLQKWNDHTYATFRKNPFSLKKSSDKIVFDKEEVKLFVESKGVTTHTAEEIEYIRLLNEAQQLLLKINDYESDHGITCYALGFSRYIPHPDGHQTEHHVSLSRDLQNGVSLRERFETHNFANRPNI